MKHKHILTLLIIIALANLQQAQAQDAGTAAAPAAPAAPAATTPPAAAATTPPADAASTATAPATGAPSATVPPTISSSATQSQEALKASAAAGGTLPATAPVVAQPTTPNFDSTALGDTREKASVGVVPISLEDAIAMTLQNNPQRAAARAALAAAQARIGTARSAGGLQVGLNGSTGLNRYYGNTSTSSSGGLNNGGGNNGGNGGGNVVIPSSSSGNHLDEAEIDATLPIYTGGSVKASVRASRAAAEAQADLTVQTEQDLVLSATSAYLNVLRNAQLLQVAESNLSVSKERQRIAALRYTAGAAARLDVFTANTTLADAVQRRITASNTYSQSKADLNILIGKPPEAGLQIDPIDRLAMRVPLPTNLSRAPENTDAQLRTLADGSRPLLASYRSQETVASENIAIAKAARKPSIGASLVGLVEHPASVLGTFAATLGLSLAQTIFDSGRARSQVDEAKSLLQQAQANTGIQRLDVSTSIEDSLFALDTAQGNLANSDAAIAEAQAALAAAQLGYQAGSKTSVDVSDAQVALLTTQTNSVNARFDVAASQANLSAAVGILSAEGQAAYQQVLKDELQHPNAVPVNGEPKRRKFLGIF